METMETNISESEFNRQLGERVMNANTKIMVASKPLEALQRSEQYLEQTHIFRLFSDVLQDEGVAREYLSQYRVGGTKSGETVFWRISQGQKVLHGKIAEITNDGGESAKKVKWVHCLMNAKTCLFGEHLIGDMESIAIVRHEVDAICGSVIIDDLTWVACGQMFLPEYHETLAGRHILLLDCIPGIEHVAGKLRALDCTVDILGYSGKEIRRRMIADTQVIPEYLIDTENIASETYMPF